MDDFTELPRATAMRGNITLYWTKQKNSQRTRVVAMAAAARCMKRSFSDRLLAELTQLDAYPDGALPALLSIIESSAGQRFAPSSLRTVHLCRIIRPAAKLLREPAGKEHHKAGRRLFARLMRIGAVKADCGESLGNKAR